MRSQRAKLFATVSETGVASLISLMSAPAAKARSPAPVMTIARTDPSVSSRSSASTSWRIVSLVERVEDLGPIQGDERDPGRGLAGRRVRRG